MSLLSSMPSTRTVNALLPSLCTMPPRLSNAPAVRVASPVVTMRPPRFSSAWVIARVVIPPPAAWIVPRLLSSCALRRSSVPLPASVPPLLSSLSRADTFNASLPEAMIEPPALSSVPVSTAMRVADSVPSRRSVVSPVNCRAPLLSSLPPWPFKVCVLMASMPVPACCTVPPALPNTALVSVRSPLLAIRPLPPLSSDVVACTVLACAPVASSLPFWLSKRSTLRAK